MPIKKRKPRILMLYDFPIKGGGSGIYVKYLALRLIERFKYEVAIAAPDQESPDPKIKFYRLKVPQIPVFISRPGLEREKKYSELTPEEIQELYIAYIRETQKVVEKFKPDIIHAHHTLVNAWAGRFMRSIYNVKLVITSHGSCLNVVASDKRYARMTKDALNAANIITVVSGDTRDKMLRMFGKELAYKTRIIPGGVRILDFPDRKPQALLDQIRKKYKIADENVVLFTGRLISEKGVEYLVKAASRINGQVVIAGDGPQKKHMEELVKKTKLSNVVLIGYVDHQTLLNVYYLADVFVAPAVWDDPMPLTVMEAMAAKLPVVVTRRGGMATAVKDGENGYFVKTRNASDIADKVNKLLSDKQLAQKMGTCGHEAVMKKFTWSEIAEKFHRLYTTL